MGYYKDTQASGGGGRNSRGVSFSRPRDGRDRGGRDGGGDREMHKTTCSNCGKACEVPFRPTGAKPVYCNDCFRTMGGNDAPRGEGRGDRGDRGRGDRGDRKPRHDRDDHGSRPPALHKEFEALNAKLDKILMLLGHDTSETIPEIKSVQTYTPVPHEIADTPEIVENLDTLDADTLV